MIDTFFTILKKSLLLVVMTMFAFTIIYVPQIHTDQAGQEYAANVEYVHAAGGGPWDFPNFLENTYTAIATAVDLVYQAWLYLKDSVLDPLVWLLGEEMLADMTADIVDWANSGFDGSPAFIENLGDFLLENADRRVGEFINSLGGVGSFICDPFRLNTQLAVALYWDYSRENRVPECTLTDAINNFEDFIAGDFSQGGWDGWFDLVAEPHNTPYGSILTAQSLAQQEAAEAKDEEGKKAEYSRGMKPIEYCTEINGPSGPVRNCNTITPPGIPNEMIAKALGVGQDRVVESDEFSESFNFLLTALTGEVFNGDDGLLGLSGGTGAGYSGYTRGSFVDDLRGGGCDLDTGIGCVVDESGSGGNVVGNPNTDLGGGSGVGGSFIANALVNLGNMLDDLDDYIADLNAFINNPFNDAETIVVAEIYLGQAEDLYDQISDDIVAAGPIVSQYTALEAQFAATDDPAEQAQINAQMTALIQQFNALNITSQQEFDALASNWDDLLALDVPPPIILPGPGPGPGVIP